MTGNLDQTEARLPDTVEQLLSLVEIDVALDKLAAELNQRYAHKSLTVVSIMTGGLVTTGHLLPKLSMKVTLDYLHVSRYRQQTSGTDLQWHRYPHTEFREQAVLLVDDIFDEGITLAAVKDYYHQQGASEVITAVLLTKNHHRQQTQYVPDYSALTVRDAYVFGFGLDYEGHWRNLPGIYCFK